MVNQNTEEWLEIRKNKIGASDAPVIMGISPYKTPYRLWEEKLGLCANSPKTPAMQRGLDLENLAREELEKMTGMLLLPEVKFHAHISWMMASLDAIDPEGKYVAEIKCPNKADHQVALNGQVPQKYIPQLQHQMEVCEVEHIHYFSFDGTHGVAVKIYRDDLYIKKILEKEKLFWQCMQEFSAPELSAKDYASQEGELWSQAASQWLSINQELQTLEKAEKQLRDLLISMSSKKNSIGGGIKLTRIVKKGNVDYATIPEMQNIDLEKYRKKTSECFRIQPS